MDCLTPMVDILSECGWKNIIIETVGAGQSEIRVVAFADRILLVDGPDRGYNPSREGRYYGTCRLDCNQQVRFT